MNDEITDSLLNLQGELPAKRILTTDQKKSLVAHLGPRTISNIQKTALTTKPGRVIFLFNSIDPQLVMDVLSNDFEGLLAPTTSRPSTE